VCPRSNGCFSSTISTWTAWDGTLVVAGSNLFKASMNDYGIKAFTWGCTNSSSINPKAGGSCTNGGHCWCAFSKSPDTNPATFTSGAWSSWVYLEETSDCTNYCVGTCATFGVYGYANTASW
jgi:hypothetical protein